MLSVLLVVSSVTVEAMVGEGLLTALTVMPPTPTARVPVPPSVPLPAVVASKINCKHACALVSAIVLPSSMIAMSFGPGPVALGAPKLTVQLAAESQLFGPAPADV